MPASAPTSRPSTASLSSFARPDAAADNIYREKVTGARPDRRELNRMLGKLAPGDVVTVTRIDRLARSTFDLFAIVKRIVDAKAQFRILGGTVGRQHPQHRALDAGGSRQPSALTH
jgi:DNA invertase Pin-like site-specific DNA recombinase